MVQNVRELDFSSDRAWIDFAYFYCFDSAKPKTFDEKIIASAARKIRARHAALGNLNSGHKNDDLSTSRELAKKISFSNLSKRDEWYARDFLRNGGKLKRKSRKLDSQGQQQGNLDEERDDTWDEDDETVYSLSDNDSCFEDAKCRSSPKKGFAVETSGLESEEGDIPFETISSPRLADAQPDANKEPNVSVEENGPEEQQNEDPGRYRSLISGWALEMDSITEIIEEGKDPSNNDSERKSEGCDKAEPQSHSRDRDTGDEENSNQGPGFSASTHLDSQVPTDSSPTPTPRQRVELKPLQVIHVLTEELRAATRSCLHGTTPPSWVFPLVQSSELAELCFSPPPKDD